MVWVAPSTSVNGLAGELMLTAIGVIVKFALAIADGAASEATVTVAALLHAAGTGAGAV